MQQTDRYIFLIEEADKVNPDLEGFLTGWYFADETEDLQGPFSTRQEAIDSMKKYAESL